VRDQRVVADAPVHQLALPPRDGRQDCGDGRACHDGVDDRAAREQLLAGDDVDRDDVERNREFLEPYMLEVLFHEPPEAGVWNQVIAGAEEPEQPAERIE
jgi:hypothetical protein